MEVPGISINSPSPRGPPPGQATQLYSLVDLVLQEQLAGRGDCRPEVARRARECFPVVRECPVFQVTIKVSVGEEGPRPTPRPSTESLGQDHLDSTLGSARQSAPPLPGTNSGAPVWDIRVQPKLHPVLIQNQKIRDDLCGKNLENVSKFGYPPVHWGHGGAFQPPWSPFPHQAGSLSPTDPWIPWSPLPSQAEMFPDPRLRWPAFPPLPLTGTPSPYWSPPAYLRPSPYIVDPSFPRTQPAHEFLYPRDRPRAPQIPDSTALDSTCPQGPTPPHCQPLDTPESLIPPASFHHTHRTDPLPEVRLSAPHSEPFPPPAQGPPGKKKPLCRSINLSSISSKLPSLSPQDPARVKSAFTKMIQQARFFGKPEVRNHSLPKQSDPSLDPPHTRALSQSSPFPDTLQAEDLPPYCQQLHSFWIRPTPSAPQVFRRRKILKSGAQVVQFDELNLSRRILSKRGHKL